MTTRTVTQLAESAFQALFNAQSREAFDVAFDGLIAERASITMDGEPVSWSHYKEYLWRDQRGGLQSSTTIEFQETVEGSLSYDSKDLKIGSVGLFYEAKMKVPELVGPDNRTIRVSVNMAFERTRSAGTTIPMVTLLSQVSKQLDSLESHEEGHH